MNYGINYRLLYVTTSDKDTNYKNLKSALEDNGIIKELEKKNIQIASNINDNNKFKMTLHEMSGMPITSIDKFDQSSFNELIGLVEPLHKQKGGDVTHKKSYKHKYLKYKAKYMEMHDVITKFSK
jgi:hypothetical protein